MKLGSRLDSIAALVPLNSKIADIGTDHAYLPAWLVLNNVVAGAIAADVAEGPCLAAKSTIKAYGIKNRIEVRRGNGLSVLKPDEVDTVIIAGMGASTIIDILSAEPELVASLSRLILQPMNGAATLRKWAKANGWYLKDERLAEEADHLYELMLLEQGEEADYSDSEYEIGPLLIKKRDCLLAKQFGKIMRHYEALLQQMSNSTKAKNSEKYESMQMLLSDLEVLKNECQG